MKFLDICAGIGGFSLGLEMAGLTCAGQVEIDDYCNKILEKHWPHVPRWPNVETLNPAELPAVELICGGYPCQPFSVAGQRRGAEDDRHLWPFIFPIVAEKRPAWCLFENVTGHVTLGLDQALSDLESIGYACQALIIPACAVDAPHQRNRVWIVAHTDGAFKNGSSSGILRQRPGHLAPAGAKDIRPPNRAPRAKFAPTMGETIPNPNRQRCQRAQILQQRLSCPAGAGGPKRRHWPAEPGVGRMVDGLPKRSHEIKALGNAVVPQLVCEIGQAILAATKGEIYD